MLITIGEKHYEISPEKHNIEAIILFGSHAYGGADNKSDVDLLIVVNIYEAKYLKLYRSRLSSELHIPQSWITIYNKKLFRKESEMGGLFFNSIKSYGKILYSRGSFIQNVFSSMPMVTDSSSEIERIKTNADLAVINYEKEILSIENALIKLAFAIRELCMNICYSHGIIEVRKFESVNKCYSFSDISMPFQFNDYKELYELKRDLISHTHSKIDEIHYDSNYLNQWKEKFNKLVEQVL